eukprot:SAG31_NODE_8163_length_1506_cov_1.321962_1_plen_53_part_10
MDSGGGRRVAHTLARVIYAVLFSAHRRHHYPAVEGRAAGASVGSEIEGRTRRR